MIGVDNREGVRVIRLEHGRANAIDVELLQALDAQLDELEAGPERAAVITASGPIFSAGVDLVRLREGGDTYLERFLPLFTRVFERLFALPRPVVAAVNGHAVAGGAILACACDQRLLADGPARVGVPEQRVGVPFPPLGLELLRHTVAPHRLPALVHGGRLLTGAEVVEWGLADELVEPELLPDAALARARELADIPRETFRITKEQLRAPALEFCRGAAGRELAGRVRRQWASAEARSAIESYLEATLGK